MKPVKFEGQNTTFAENQEEYQPLPALKFDDEMGNVISCWKMKWWERFIVLFTGKIWLNLASFNMPLTPSYVAVRRKEVFILIKESIMTKFLKFKFKIPFKK